MDKATSSQPLVLVVEAPDGGRLTYPLPLVAGLDPLRWLAAAGRHLPMLRDATAWCEPLETTAERSARIDGRRGTTTAPSTSPPSPAPTPTSAA
jgi:hypothetical protein